MLHMLAENWTDVKLEMHIAIMKLSICIEGVASICIELDLHKRLHRSWGNYFVITSPEPLCRVAMELRMPWLQGWVGSLAAWTNSPHSCLAWCYRHCHLSQTHLTLKSWKFQSESGNLRAFPPDLISHEVCMKFTKCLQQVHVCKNMKCTTRRSQTHQ